MSADETIDASTAANLTRTNNALFDVRTHRLARVREQLHKNNCPAILLYDPVNIRYATDTSNMQIWTGRNPSRYVMVFADGRVIAWEFHSCEHVWDGLNLDLEMRSAVGWTFFSAGTEAGRRADVWGAEIADALGRRAPNERRLAVDRLDPIGAACLIRNGLTLLDGQAMMEMARTVKSSGELVLINESLRACEKGIERMHRELRPGMTEQDLWANLHHENIRHGGEWIETRLLASGDRTNPWMHECSSRVLQRGELLAFDTDMVGPNGYCSDISRTWTVGHTRPSDEQRKLYEAAYSQVHFNMDLLRPGMTFREFSEKAWKIPEPYLKNRYSCVAHGIGMVDEYPSIAHQVDWESAGYDGRFETGMTLCVESYIGAEGGSQGVKLEQQVVLTECDCVPLTLCSFETRWL
ncbi:aminopeptidase P [Paraburkholderia caffeinilytica]|uniref:Peptidase M24 n=1 Tax=Paraburkholderia caffeinilytica TaxID=1761016 RepID=A0ABQ1MHT9_9BURK|nr:Xaa-Pro peptidase family protein [Paraburkholderia caffeinilytica]AXL49980.1 aminopeptidase P [Paraburkholderia caffeinilytica]GGC39390.1 peptidase M24 [Paraburkholderia caffeinilytica]CAB3786610.1 Dimethlysulfonioproprionate lyase DddP [Paraburkholderia caffeinilytica]